MNRIRAIVPPVVTIRRERRNNIAVTVITNLDYYFRNKKLAKLRDVLKITLQCNITIDSKKHLICEGAVGERIYEMFIHEELLTRDQMLITY